MKNFIISVLCLAGIGIMSSCSTDEKIIENKKVLTEEEFVSLLKFKTLTPSAASRSNPTIPPKTKSKGILKAKIARKSKGCNSGFGLCDFKLFPSSSSIELLSCSLEENEYLLEVDFNEESNAYYISLLLDQPLPEGATDDIASLKIEEDIYWLNDEDAIEELEVALNESSNKEKPSEDNESLLKSNEYIKIDADTLILDPNLGSYGGYQIELTTD